jgi:hypothetical protein
VTFLQPDITCKPKTNKAKQQNVKSRLLTPENLTNLQNDLKNLHWNDVLLTDNVDDCYTSFWTTFKLLYDLHIPLVTVRRNRNFHKINNFMTKGLLTSRRTKVGLLKISLVNPTNENVQNFNPLFSGSWRIGLQFFKSCTL